MDDSLELVGIPEIAARLGVEPEAARTIANAGLLGQTFRIGRQVVTESSAVEALATRPFVEPPHPAATVIRLDLARPIEAGEDIAWPKRKWVGWKRDMKENERLDAIRGWWRIAPGLEGELIVFTLKTFVVEVYTIASYDGEVGGVRRLKLATPDPSSGAESFELHRLSTGRGGNVINLPAAD